jgi:hypothetical protein
VEQDRPGHARRRRPDDPQPRANPKPTPPPNLAETARQPPTRDPKPCCSRLPAEPSPGHSTPRRACYPLSSRSVRRTSRSSSDVACSEIVLPDSVRNIIVRPVGEVALPDLAVARRTDGAPCTCRGGRDFRIRQVLESRRHPQTRSCPSKNTSIETLSATSMSEM